MQSNAERAGLAGKSGVPAVLRFYKENACFLKSREVCWRRLYQIPGEAVELLSQHRAIYEAIQAGVGELAEEQMKSHLNHVESSLTY